MKLLCIPAIALAAFTTAAFSQDAVNYPNRPIRMIVPFAPGGGLDISTRLIGQKLGVPQAIVNKLSAEVARIVRLPDVAHRFELDGAEAVGSTPKEFAAFLKAEMQKWSQVVRDAGIKPEQ